ncbi:cytochrome c biogenesis protein ResB [Methylophaga nitratireducenticrescens]|uniref:Cytochrome c-type biogenesis protein Ccs1/ResB n=1 Tax=Methylophaga nitratireducenticrescens TaxID=754476 RepID=I1XGS0_METNJ|nr:cytochrome c biogenesis protein ResB [Methylophaga nitratireducenticrescens]AFI83589.1 cytochrome c biogenesis protein ResB [Methylophaga nitratireducenticrescens]AUZ83647.1 cytochrome c biogenesis protein ResB [Methylophaga nitratireducenticrescens]
MSDSTKKGPSSQSFPRRLFLFIGSMELAISLLLTLAVASVIGTVLQQNQPYADYVIKFGPFWFDVFEQLGLYDVYSAIWFIAILALLVLSTSVCVIRHLPAMVKEMWQLRTNVQKKSLKAMHHSVQWQSNTAMQAVADNLQQEFKERGFRSRQTIKQDNAILISAMRGGMNRLGYLFTHIAIVVICIGGLFDSNMPLKIAEWRGEIKIETRDLSIREIPSESRLAAGGQGFRGTVSIPEGKAANVVFLPVRDGYLLQTLPFRIEVQDFRIEHYPNGQPKSFESDLVIHDDQRAEPFEATIAVNHPLVYRGHSIYQASFSDGGSLLSLDAWPLDSRAGTEPVSIQTKVFDSRQMLWGQETMQLEMIGFRPFNINPDPTEEDSRNVRDFGPNFTFKLRTETGEAREYENYMFPVERDGREYFLSGVRNSPAESFAYLYLPVDEDGSLQQFLNYSALLRDEELVSDIANSMMKEALAMLPERDEALEGSLQQTLETLITMFVRGGFDEVRDFIDNNIPDAERDNLAPAYLGMLREMLARIYFSMDGVHPQTVTNDQLLFLQDSVDTIGTLSRYGSPVFLQLTDFEHVQSTGLQIAKAPGKNVVYFGCALLIIGVFLLFYLPQRRLWAWLEQNNNRTEIIFAGSTNRNPRDFDIFFSEQQTVLKTKTGNSSL